MQNDLGITGPLENRTLFLQLATEFLLVHDLAIVGYRHVPQPAAVRDNGLNVRRLGTPGGAVPHMPYGVDTLQGCQLRFAEYIHCQAPALEHGDLSVMLCGDAAGFLSPVLQGMQAIVCHAGGIRNVIAPEHTAFFMQFIEHKKPPVVRFIIQQGVNCHTGTGNLEPQAADESAMSSPAPEGRSPASISFLTKY